MSKRDTRPAIARLAELHALTLQIRAAMQRSIFIETDNPRWKWKRGN